jgi:hypothetical protein
MSIENRRSRRKRVQDGIDVRNALTGEVVGFVGNLSVDGMLLIANRGLPENALFQFSFELPVDGGTPRRFEVGVHEQWGEPANIPGQHWYGFRIIDIAPEDRQALAAWVDRYEDAS